MNIGDVIAVQRSLGLVGCSLCVENEETVHWFTFLTGDLESDARRVRRHFTDISLEIKEKHSMMAANAAQGFDFGALIEQAYEGSVPWEKRTEDQLRADMMQGKPAFGVRTSNGWACPVKDCFVAATKTKSLRKHLKNKHDALTISFSEAPNVLVQRVFLNKAVFSLGVADQTQMQAVSEGDVRRGEQLKIDRRDAKVSASPAPSVSYT